MKKVVLALVLIAVGVCIGHFVWKPVRKSSKPKVKPPNAVATPEVTADAAKKPDVPPADNTKLVPLELEGFHFEPSQEAQVLTFHEKGGQHQLTIYIGNIEGQAIDRKLKDLQLPRPMTHDLLKSVIDATGAKLDKVVLTDLKDQTFRANLVLNTGGKTVNVDARPSDAIALAVRMNAPVLVNADMFTAYLDDLQKAASPKPTAPKDAQPKKDDF